MTAPGPWRRLTDRCPQLRALPAMRAVHTAKPRGSPRAEQRDGEEEAACAGVCQRVPAALGSAEHPLPPLGPANRLECPEKLLNCGFSGKDAEEI